MRISPLALALVLAPGLALAQEPGVAVNMSRGLNSGMGLGWTFKENWTLQPTLGLGYSDQEGFMASVGSTVLRSFNLSERIYAYVGAGVYYGSGNGAYVGTSTGGRTQPGGVGPNQAAINPTYQSYGDLMYLTTPAGLRGQVYGGFELFLEAAYQHTLMGEFAPNQSGQFSGTPTSRFGATFGLSLRMN
jgi:hypothetical protein